MAASGETCVSPEAWAIIADAADGMPCAAEGHGDGPTDPQVARLPRLDLTRPPKRLHARRCGHPQMRSSSSPFTVPFVRENLAGSSVHAPQDAARRRNAIAAGRTTALVTRWRIARRLDAPAQALRPVIGRSEAAGWGQRRARPVRNASGAWAVQTSLVLITSTFSFAWSHAALLATGLCLVHQFARAHSRRRSVWLL